MLGDFRFRQIAVIGFFCRKQSLGGENMATPDAALTKTKLSLLDAERRIDALEVAAAKALLLAAETLRRQKDVDKHKEVLLACVELLFTELQMEGAKHNQFVESSLKRTATALAELKISIKQRNR
jgi:hypothetical protein